jgi:transcriptional regulator with XRE-family HTH domain
MVILVFDELKTSVKQSGLPLRYISYRSGVCRQTLAKWLLGYTVFPRIDTMLRVAAVLGQHIELTDTVKKMVNYYPKPTIKPPPVIKIGMSRHDVRMTMMKLQ